MPFTSTILRTFPIATETLGFEVTRPAAFSFKAGQSLDLTLPSQFETDTYGLTRSFSIASAPTVHTLMLATRLRDSAFKRALQKITPDTSVTIEGPFGDMTLPEQLDGALVCLAGGIGITPIMSIISEWDAKKFSFPLYLLYSNQEKNKVAFANELHKLSEQNKNFIYIPTLTREKDPDYAHGRISRNVILARILNLQKNKYYIAGTPEFVVEIKKILIGLDIPRTQILNEPFDGY